MKLKISMFVTFDLYNHDTEQEIILAFFDVFCPRSRKKLLDCDNCVEQEGPSSEVFGCKSTVIYLTSEANNIFSVASLLSNNIMDNFMIGQALCVILVSVASNAIAVVSIVV